MSLPLEVPRMPPSATHPPQFSIGGHIPTLYPGRQAPDNVPSPVSPLLPLPLSCLASSKTLCVHKVVTLCLDHLSSSVTTFFQNPYSDLTLSSNVSSTFLNTALSPLLVGLADAQIKQFAPGFIIPICLQRAIPIKLCETSGYEVPLLNLVIPIIFI